MNIDDLIKLAQLLQPSKGDQTDGKLPLGNQFIGKYVIVRSRNEGINAGKVLELDHTGVILEDARRLYYHKPANKELSWYEGVALEGLSKDSKVGAEVTKLIVEDYSITVCTKEAEKSIRGAKTNAQS
jgi:hypothetical protein